MSKAIQEYYSGDASYCYGCGGLNDHGLQIRTFWHEDKSVTRYTPQPYHMAIPGYVYGGLIASLIDCHSTGAAAAALYQAQGREMDSDPPIRCLTASLLVDYLRPTPLGIELEVRGHIKEIDGHRVTVASSLIAEEVECARGLVVAVSVPDSYIDKLMKRSR